MKTKIIAMLGICLAVTVALSGCKGDDSGSESGSEIKDCGYIMDASASICFHNAIISCTPAKVKLVEDGSSVQTIKGLSDGLCVIETTAPGAKSICRYPEEVYTTGDISDGSYCELA